MTPLTAATFPMEPPPHPGAQESHAKPHSIVRDLNYLDITIGGPTGDRLYTLAPFTAPGLGEEIRGYFASLRFYILRNKAIVLVRVFPMRDVAMAIGADSSREPYHQSHTLTLLDQDPEFRCAQSGLLA
jgi:hypothetical protein